MRTEIPEADAEGVIFLFALVWTSPPTSKIQNLAECKKYEPRQGESMSLEILFRPAESIFQYVSGIFNKVGSNQIVKTLQKHVV